MSSHDLAVRHEKPKCDFASKDKKKRTQVLKGSHRKTSLKMYKKKNLEMVQRNKKKGVGGVIGPPDEA